eukprot:scaffold1058_cov362-Prasinococcus_capsulatus_cf.AAC.16
MTAGSRRGAHVQDPKRSAPVRPGYPPTGEPGPNRASTDTSSPCGSCFCTPRWVIREGTPGCPACRARSCRDAPRAGSAASGRALRGTRGRPSPEGVRATHPYPASPSARWVAGRRWTNDEIDTSTSPTLPRWPAGRIGSATPPAAARQRGWRSARSGPRSSLTRPLACSNPRRGHVGSASRTEGGPCTHQTGPAPPPAGSRRGGRYLTPAARPVRAAIRSPTLLTKVPRRAAQGRPAAAARAQRPGGALGRGRSPPIVLCGPGLGAPAAAARALT